MSQKESQKENSQKAVLTQIQNQASQDRVPSQDRGSQASSYVASQGQVLTQTQATEKEKPVTQAESQVRNEEDEMRYGADPFFF